MHISLDEFVLAYVDPLFILQDLPNLVAVKDADFSDVDAVFCCLPHGTTQVIYIHHAFSEMFPVNC